MVSMAYRDHGSQSVYGRVGKATPFGVSGAPSPRLKSMMLAVPFIETLHSVGSAKLARLLIMKPLVIIFHLRGKLFS